VVSSPIIRDDGGHWVVTYPGRPGALFFVPKNDPAIIGTGDEPYTPKSPDDPPVAGPPKNIVLKPGWKVPAGFENTPVKYDRVLLELANTKPPEHKVVNGSYQPIEANAIPDVSKLVDPTAQ